MKLKAKKKLSQSEDHYYLDTVQSFRSIMMSVDEGIMATDRYGKIEMMNTVAEKMTGWDEKDACGKCVEEIFNIVNEDNRHAAESPVQRVLREGNVVGLSNHTLLISRDGVEYPITNGGSPIIDENGILRGVILVFRDQTNEFKVQKALRNSEEKFNYIFDNSVIGKSFTLPTGELKVNKAFCDITGYSREEINQKKWQEISHPDDIEENERIVSSLLSGEMNSARFIKRYLHKNGSVVWADVGTSICRDTDGTPLYFLTTINDITERVNAESEIKKLTEELEQRVIFRTSELESANQELESYSYSVSHDLRAPLRAIHSYTRILLEDYGRNLDSEGQRICSIIESGTISMGKLIDDLLAFSHLNSTDLVTTEIDIMAEVRAVVQELTFSNPSIRAKINLMDIPACSGDPFTIRLVLMNLISNAIKYSSKNSEAVVEIGHIDSDNEIIYYVRDNGVGFDMQYADKLFGVFQRLHSSSDFEGNGVGLAIVKRIISRHHGRVWAEAETGKGAVFYFTLRDKE